MIRSMLWATLLVASLVATATSNERPNVLFVISDDLNCRIGCYGDPIAQTPHLDRLAAMGVRFDRAYCQFPLCNPTRSSVLSGQYPATTRVFDNETLLMLGEGQLVLPDFFASQGYVVAEHGKIFHGPNRGLKPGDAPPPVVERAGREIRWFTPAERAEQQASEPDYWNDHHSPYRHRTVADPQRYAWANVYGPLEPGDRGVDAPIADQAIASLGRFAEQDGPFFLAVGFHRPHVPLTAPAEYFDLYRTAEIPLPPDFANEPQLAPGMPADELRANIDLFAARPFTASEAREALRAYYASTSYMDAELGRVLDELERLGLRENTIVMFWGDHGWHLAEKGMWAKGTTFEVSARGPLIIADPREASAGQTCGRIVEYVDMYPTLVDLCGIERPAWLEGTSLRALVEDPQAEWDRPASTVQVRGWFLGRSVRTDRWRYTEWDEGRRGAMLFDHERDPHEMRNLADDPQFASTVAELRALLGEASP